MCFYGPDGALPPLFQFFVVPGVGDVLERLPVDHGRTDDLFVRLCDHPSLNKVIEEDISIRDVRLDIYVFITAGEGDDPVYIRRYFETGMRETSMDQAPCLVLQLIRYLQGHLVRDDL